MARSRGAAKAQALELHRGRSTPEASPLHSLELLGLRESDSTRGVGVCGFEFGAHSLGRGFFVGGWGSAEGPRASAILAGEGRKWRVRIQQRHYCPLQNCALPTRMLPDEILAEALGPGVKIGSVRWHISHATPFRRPSSSMCCQRPAHRAPASRADGPSSSAVQPPWKSASMSSSHSWHLGSSR